MLHAAVYVVGVHTVLRP